jgi:hypothetical protein
MGLLTFSINVTLDGCVDHREGIADDETHAKIGVISLPPWGEQLDAIDPYQAELNRRFSDYNAELRQLARDARVAYIPFYERFCDLLRASPGKPFTSHSVSCPSIATSFGSSSCACRTTRSHGATVGNITATESISIA